MAEWLSVGLLAGLVVIFGTITVWAIRARRLQVKLVAGIPAGLMTVVLGFATTAALVGYGRVNTTYTNPIVPISIVSSPEKIARGEKFARVCAGCHSATNQLPLTGQVFGPPIGTLYAPNLTQAHLKEWSDGEIIRAIREGIDRDGRSLIIMPAGSFRSISDDDVQALVAYLRSQPADAATTPPKTVSVLGAIMLGSVIGPEVFTHQPPIAGPVVAPTPGATAEYGAYLSTTLGCRECHGNNLGGGISSESGNATPSLVALKGTWSEADFVKALRTGTTPEGKTLSDEMPWKDLEKFSDDDLLALFAYLQSLNK